MIGIVLIGGNLLNAIRAFCFICFVSFLFSCGYYGGDVPVSYGQEDYSKQTKKNYNQDYQNESDSSDESIDEEDEASTKHVRRSRINDDLEQKSEKKPTSPVYFDNDLASASRPSSPQPTQQYQHNTQGSENTLQPAQSKQIQPSPLSQNNTTTPVDVYYHTVKKGETMYSISNFYNIDIYELAKTNGIADLKNLPVGTKLIISNYKQKQEVAKPSVYTVKKGDTLFSIAKANGVKTDYLQKINNMPTIDIKIGQQILLTQNFIQSEQPEHSTNSTDANGAMQVGKGIKQNNDESQSKVQSSDVISKPVKLSSKGFLWPVDGVVSEKFGTKKNGVKNDGILIDAPQGTPVKASKSGVVAYVGSELKDYGNLVIVNCDQFLVIYAHLLSVNVKKGQKIQSGETIGLVGKTGNVSSPKLFFSIRSSKKNQKNGSQLTLYDPLKFLDKEHG